MSLSPQRRSSLLQGQTSIARKVYEFIPSSQTASATAFDICSAIHKETGAGVDIHVLRGCLRALKESGLVNEVVSGSFRQVAIKEKETMPALKPVQAEKNPAEKLGAMEALGNIAASVRQAADLLRQAADDIDTVAVGIEEKSNDDRKALETLRQLQALLKG
ncbi:hypothetical protein [Castellaniella denitrificans]|uniref:Uncharacterized protein n=1 Tax=Castellaniella denitrificans TaxID=56119 RepID=A0ABT4M773_9BURK|nr:hypothetical protein [Castellaniella denitrificans]MCZ4331078.1 hypothetical protein [Castellaniella denitrificans]